MPIEITAANFEEVVVKSDKPVVVDFWATWCGPCKMMSPVVDELAEELGAAAVVGKINVDEQQELAARFGVMTIRRRRRKSKDCQNSDHPYKINTPR